MNTILQILQWAIPSGGIGAAIAWLANRRLRTVAEKKQVEDTYKQMYDMVSAELISLQKQNQMNYDKIEELRNDNDKTRRALNRLSRAVEAIQLCPHRAECPVRDELQDSGEVNDCSTESKLARAKRQRKDVDQDRDAGTDKA